MISRIQRFWVPYFALRATQGKQDSKFRIDRGAMKWIFR
jgi:hypothetical protein